MQTSKRSWKEKVPSSADGFANWHSDKASGVDSTSYSTGVGINIAIPNQISDRLSHQDKIEIVRIE